MPIRAVALINAPNVTLQSGNVGNSTIFTNSTSAMVTTPTLNYPTGFNLVIGSYVSGTVPVSVNTLDSNYFITAAKKVSTDINPTASATASMPASQQRVFQNTRGQKAYYAFYRDTVSSTDKCWYAYSTDGLAWTFDQNTGLVAGFVTCSVVFREDSANSRTILYLTASKISTLAGTGNDIVFEIGTIADTATAITWGTVQTARASGTNENQGYPVTAISFDGFLHIAFSWVQNPGGTVNDFSNVGVCDTTTTVSSFGTTNPTWTCQDPSLVSPFRAGTAGIERLSFMPHILPNVNGHGVMLVSGLCSGSEQLVCNTPSGTVFCSPADCDAYIFYDWNGASLTWGTRVIGPQLVGFGANSPADVRSAVVNATSGLVYYAWRNSTGAFSRTFASPYGSSNFSPDTPIATGTINGLHLTINMGLGSTPKRLFAFYISGTTTLSSENTTMTSAWGPAQTEYLNSSISPKWISSPYVFNNATGATNSFTTLPFVWMQQAATTELWFKTHSLTSLATGASTEFTFAVSSAPPLQLNFTIVQQYTLGSVTVTIQVYNYTGGLYPTSGQGYLTYTSSPTAGTDETQSLTISTNPQFYTQSGQAKVKIASQFLGSAFNQKVNYLRLYYYQTTYGNTPYVGYPTSYNVVLGSYGSGTVPGSVNATDSNYFITLSPPLNQRITPTPSTTANLPESQQRVFQNTRGQKAYYSFYRDTVSSTDKCWYAYSPDGRTWTVDQDTTLAAGFTTCSVIFREDSANSRTLAYLTAAKISSTIGTGNDIVFEIGTIGDGATSITWGALQTIRGSSTTENQGYPVIAQAASGYLHVIFAYTNNPSGTGSDVQGLGVCSSQTKSPTTNPTWTCSTQTVTTSNNISLLGYIPHALPDVSGSDILIIEGACRGVETVSCTNLDTVERTHKLSWDGTTQTFTPSTSSFSISGPADLRSAIVNATSARVHYLYDDGTNLVSRFIDASYTTWSSATIVNSGTTNGLHLTINMGLGATPKKLFAFYISGTTTVFSRNATDAQSWSTAQTEYTNSTTAPRWVSSPYIANNVTGATNSFQSIPFTWVQQSATPELWIRTHSFTPQASSAATEFVIPVPTITPLQLNFTIVQQYDVASAIVTLQVYNYTGGVYPTTGQGYLTYTSSAVPSTDETKSLAITTNPQFYTSSGLVKVKITGQPGLNQLSQKVNLLKVFYYTQSVVYVLKIVNQQLTSHNIRLNRLALSATNINRLNNFTAWFQDGTVQLQILSGSFTTQTGTYSTLGAGSVAYLAITVVVPANSPGVSTVDCYLQIYIPGTSAHTDYRLTFKLT